MRVFLPSRMTIASNLAVPRYITRTKIILWTLLIVQNRFFFFLSLVNNFLSLHYFEINHSRFYFDLCLFTFSKEFAEKRVWIFHGSRDDLFAGSMHLSTGEVSSIIAPSRGKLFIPHPLFSSITKVFFSTDSFSFLLFCRDFSSDRLLFTHEKKKGSLSLLNGTFSRRVGSSFNGVDFIKRVADIDIVPFVSQCAFNIIPILQPLFSRINKPLLCFFFSIPEYLYVFM